MRWTGLVKHPDLHKILQNHAEACSTSGKYFMRAAELTKQVQSLFLKTYAAFASMLRAIMACCT